MIKTFTRSYPLSEVLKWRIHDDNLWYRLTDCAAEAAKSADPGHEEGIESGQYEIRANNDVIVVKIEYDDETPEE